MADDPQNAPASQGGDPQGDPTASQGGDKPQGEPRTFTQEELNRHVQDRLAKERKKYEGFDDLKRKAEEFDKLQDAQRSQEEKLQTKLSEAERRAADAEHNYQELRVTRAIELAAGDFVDPEAAALLIDRAALEYEDDGSAKEESVKSALEELAERRPYLKGQAATPKTPSVDGGARPPSGDKAFDLEGTLKRLEERAAYKLR